MANRVVKKTFHSFSHLDLSFLFGTVYSVFSSLLGRLSDSV